MHSIALTTTPVYSVGGCGRRRCLKTGIRMVLRCRRQPPRAFFPAAFEGMRLRRAETEEQPLPLFNCEQHLEGARNGNYKSRGLSLVRQGFASVFMCTAI